MSKFARLKKLHVASDASIEFPLPELQVGDGPTPFLLVVPATADTNEAYANALLKSRAVQALVRSGGVPTLKQRKATREEDAKLYPEHVVTGWGHMTDDQGKALTFTKDDCRDLLEQFTKETPDVMDRLRGFCSTVENWRPNAVDIVGVAGNS